MTERLIRRTVMEMLLLAFEYDMNDESTTMGIIW